MIAALAVFAAACNSGPNSRQDAQNEVARRESAAVAVGQQRMIKSQQIPSFDWSQVRQTIIDAETIQATGAVSTSQGIAMDGSLVWWCPSIGAPVAATTQLTPSQQYVDIQNDGSREKYPVDQAEPTGVYPGDTTGTWVICTDDAGKKIGKYYEGFVDTTIGIVPNLPPAKRVVVTGSTFTFKEENK